MPTLLILIVTLKLVNRINKLWSGYKFMRDNLGLWGGGRCDVRWIYRENEEGSSRASEVNYCVKKWPLVLIFIPITNWQSALTPQIHVICLQKIIILSWIPMVLMIFEDLKPITPWGSSLALIVMLMVILFPRTPICPSGPVLESLSTNTSSIYKEMNIDVWC